MEMEIINHNLNVTKNVRKDVNSNKTSEGEEWGAEGKGDKQLHPK
jgi:hypothetical protein